jgi:hypothetical protein
VVDLVLSFIARTVVLSCYVTFLQSPMYIVRIEMASFSFTVAPACGDLLSSELGI